MKRILFLLLRLSLFPPLIAALLLERDPSGVILYFMNANGPPFRETVSYFDLLLVGYGDFGPFLTGVLTCVLSVLALVFLFLPREGLRKAIFCLSAAAVIASLLHLLTGLPVTSGLQVFQPVNAAVSGLLLLETGLVWLARFQTRVKGAHAPPEDG